MKRKTALIVIILLIVVSFFSFLVYIELFGSHVILPTPPSHESRCNSMAKLSCETAGQLPSNWGAKELMVEGKETSCAELVRCNSCSECGFDRA